MPPRSTRTLYLLAALSLAACRERKALQAPNGVSARDGHRWYPYGVALEPQGNLYVADTYDQVIRVVWH